MSPPFFENPFQNWKGFFFAANRNIFVGFAFIQGLNRFSLPNGDQQDPFDHRNRMAGA